MTYLPGLEPDLEVRRELLFIGGVIGLLPTCKEYPAGEMCFYVMDEKKEGKAK